jgi:toxin HigB-1
MIRNLADKLTQDVYDGTNSRHSRKLPRSLHPKARRLLDQINAAPSIEFLRIPPGNRLEKLGGDLEGYWSLRINDQWRIIFRWSGDNALEVRITDYH